MVVVIVRCAAVGDSLLPFMTTTGNCAVAHNPIYAPLEHDAQHTLTEHHVSAIDLVIIVLREFDPGWHLATWLQIVEWCRDHRDLWTPFPLRIPLFGVVGAATVWLR